MSATDRSAAVLAALRTSLLADPALAALVDGRIFELPPARAGMPSLTIRCVSGLDASSADTDAQTLTFDCDVWDRFATAGDLSAAHAIMAHVRRILHMQSIAVSGVAVLSVLCTGSQGPYRDPDGVTLHGVVTLRVRCGHEAPSA